MITRSLHGAGMKPKTLELLHLLLWASDMAVRPTFRNLTGSFESWAYRNGLAQQLDAMERERWLESKRDAKGERVHRLTEAGRRLALGPRDPAARWKRRWDGKWRMVLYDIRQTEATLRKRLRRSLTANWFGYLQDSVWVTPDPLSEKLLSLGSSRVDVESLILLEARPCAGEKDSAVVAGAWNFSAINQSYANHANVLDRAPRESIANESSAKRWRKWFQEEARDWAIAMQLDPLLPTCLHPAGYQGVNAWKRRKRILAKAGQQIRAFRRREPD